MCFWSAIIFVLPAHIPNRADGAGTSVVLVKFLAPHSSKFGLRDQRAHRGGRATLLFHCLRAGCFGFGNQTLDSHLSIGSSFSGRLLMNGKLLLLQFAYPC